MIVKPRLSSPPLFAAARPRDVTKADCYNAAMTLLEIRYALQSPLTPEQIHSLSEFANTYGLRKFKLNHDRTELSFEYDASRLRETQVAHALGQASIAVTKKLN